MLYYYVFRYRPVFPVNSPEHQRLLTSIDDVFEKTLPGPDGRIVGGYDKVQYLGNTSAHFGTRKLRYRLRPEPLCVLLQGARQVFTPLYCERPDVDVKASEEAKSQYLRELDAYEEAHYAASERLESSTHMISIFRVCTEDLRRHWSQCDGAVDQLAPSCAV